MVGDPEVTEAQARLQLSRLAAVLAVLALVLIVVSGIHRTSVDAVCLAWGDCSGWSYLTRSAGSVGALHLGVSALLAFITIGLAAVSRALRTDGRAHAISTAAIILIGVQIAMLFVPANGTAAVWSATIHLGATALLLACALALVQPLVPSAGLTRLQAATAGTWFRPLLLGTIGAVFAVLVSGAYLAATTGSSSCEGWPVCGISMSEPLTAQISGQVAHQALVGSAMVLLALMLVDGLRHRIAAPLLTAFAAVFGAEIAIGALSASGVAASSVETLHFGVAGISWALLVRVALLTTPGTTHAETTDHTTREVLRDYFRVTKPGIMLLLLITTLGAMLVAGAGWPSPSLILLTLLGGALASGGASALNCYIDRDIDVIMSRTRKRPIPTGRLTGDQVRNFGLTLSALSVIVLALFVNPLAALLALAGNLFYVIIYTRWLKRSTPQNIVIGGAAGAFPPLVGWAAVTGSLNLTAFLLFALIYYWTPPHFWSLALLKARDYGRAAVPMLPVTHGDDYTRRMILLYAIQLVAITLLLVPAGYVGMLYLIAAVVLGGVFVGFAARMYVEGTSRLAWRLFKYSNYYLALILLAMVVDRAITR